MAAFGTMPTQRFKLLLSLLMLSGVIATVSQISDLRKCGDKTCSVTLSRATVLARYPSNNPLHLSLARGDIVEIKSKSAGQRPELWGGEIDGRRGYFPKVYVKEFDVKIDNPVFEVATEDNVWSKQPPPPSHHQQQQQQEESIKQAPPPESASSVDKMFTDDTEIDETDLTDMDDGGADQMPKEQDPTLKAKSESADSPAEEKKENTKQVEQARLKDRLLQDIEALQRSLKNDVPMDPQVFNDFLAKQFGSDSAASASALPPSSSGDEEENKDEKTDKTDPGGPGDSTTTTQDTETKTPDADQTDLDDEDDQTKPVAPEDIKPATEVEPELEEEEKGEVNSPYINGVVEMEGGDEEEEEEEEVPGKEEEEKIPEKKEEEKIPEKKEEIPEKKEEIPEKKEEIPEKKEEKIPEKKEEEKIPEKKEEKIPEKKEEEKIPEKKDEIPEKKEEKIPEKKEEIPEKKEEKIPEKKEEGKIPEKKDEIPEKKEEKIPEKKEEIPEKKEEKIPEKKEEGKIPEKKEEIPEKKEEKIPEKKEEIPEKKEEIPEKKEAIPEKKEKIPEKKVVETEDKASKDQTVTQVERKDSVPTKQTDETEAPKDAVRVDSTLVKSPDDSVDIPVDSVGAVPPEGTGETAETMKEGGVDDKQKQPAVQEQEKLKVSDKAPSVKDTAGEGAKPGKLDSELNEEKRKPEIQPDKTQPKPASPSASAYQPVDIEFVAGQVKGGGIILDSSQPPAEQPLPTRTPALQDSPSLREEPKILETATDAKHQLTLSESQETTLIDGTRFYVVDGEIADIVPESVQVGEGSESVAQEVESSPAPPQVTQEKDIQPTATTALPEKSTVGEVPFPQVQNRSKEAAPDSHTEQLVNQGIDGNLPHKVNVEQYQTSADILGRKVLSVDQHAQPKPDGTRDVPQAEPHPKQTPEQGKNPQGVPPSSDASASKQAPAQQTQPSETLDNPSVTIEGEEPSGTAADKKEENREKPKEEPEVNTVTDKKEEGHEKTKEDPDVDRTAPVLDTPGKDSVTPPPPPEESWVTKLSSDAETEEESREAESSRWRQTQEGSSREAEETPKNVTPPPTDSSAWDGVPPPPAEQQTTEGETQGIDEPTVEGDPYQMDDFYGRKISDEQLTKAEEEEEAAARYPSGSSVGSLEAQSRAFVEKLPPSIQSLLEQEPLGLSPGMTVMVTVMAFIVFLSVACFSFLCSTGNKKAGTKSPKEVVSELEEKLLIAVKEKENLEDLLKENQTENKQMKTEVSDLQSKSGSASTDLQNVKLHNEVLKSQVSSLQTETSELQEKLSRKTDDFKTKDKKTKDIEKEAKKLQDVKHKLEQDLQKRVSEQQRVEYENENLKTTIQNLTDQVQQLDTSKQQLLLEAEDWKEKVDELKERIDQVEQENRQSQETLSFKDSEIEVMRDCYLQLKAFEKGDGGDGEEEDDDTGDHSKEVQEKIQTMMDVSKVNATLRAVQEERDNLDNRLKIENDARRELEEQLQCVRREMESSMSDKMKAERQCLEAQTKLNVLSSYFKDKELQLQRELGEHEALKKQNLSKLDNADENTRTMHKELELSRQQVDSLKRELTASERDFRAQIAANEKKAHENWLNARAAERELKETKHEAAVLRQKLTDLERRQLDLIRPLPTRGMPPPGMLNGPPPPGMERSPSRGSMPPGPVPPGAVPPGLPPPVFREGEFAMSPRDRERLPPSHPARHMPPPDARSPPPPPRMLPPDSRASPPRMLPPEARSPPPYDRRGPLPPPHLMDSRSPGARLPPPDMGPPTMRGPLPPRMGLPPMGSPGPRMDSPRDSRQGPPYGRQPPPVGDGRRHQSQV